MKKEISETCIRAWLDQHHPGVVLTDKDFNRCVTIHMKTWDDINYFGEARKRIEKIIDDAKRSNP